jgi:hypothetical protein
MTLPVVMRAAPTAVKAGTWAITNLSAQPTIPATSPYSIIVRGTVTAAAYTSMVTDSVDDGVTLTAEL